VQGLEAAHSAVHDLSWSQQTNAEVACIHRHRSEYFVYDEEGQCYCSCTTSDVAPPVMLLTIWEVHHEIARWIDPLCHNFSDKEKGGLSNIAISFGV
jgi:hypothetical protein